MNKRLIALGVTAALVAAACSSSTSLQGAGNDPAPTDPIETPSQTTIAGAPSPTGTTPAGIDPPGTVASQQPTTTATPLGTLRGCPVEALEAGGEPVDLLFWHGLNGDNEDAINRLTDEYNASQARVRVQAENQGSYAATIDKYLQSGQGNRPDAVILPDYIVQTIIDTDSVIPIDACIAADGFDTSQFRPSALAAYEVAGVQWSIPFQVSSPVLYYNRLIFEAAGLDPDRPPQTLQQLRDYSQAIVDSGTAAFGIALDTSADSGGGWFIEQWFANNGDLYVDNGNGRLAPTSGVEFDGLAGVELLTFLQNLLNDGLAVNVGDNPSQTDHLLKLADSLEPAAMTIATSAALGTVLSILGGGLIDGVTADDIGVGPLPGRSETPRAIVGGGSLYVVADHGDQKSAAAWDFIEFLSGTSTQSVWATLTGYVPTRSDALDLDPVASVYETDPRFRVAYDQLADPNGDPSLVGPILGPQREVRNAVARAVATIYGGGDVTEALRAAAEQSNALIADYNSRN